MLKVFLSAKNFYHSLLTKIIIFIRGNKRSKFDIKNSIDYEIMNWKGIEIVYRKKSVDKEQVCWMGESLFWNKFKERPIREEDIVLDLGSHIGSFALLAAITKQCKVFAFEPDYESFSLCKINTLLNSVEDKVTNLCAAVASETGKMILYKATENWGHTIIPDGGSSNILTGNQVEIDCFSLSDALKYSGNRCAFMKFNIEGAEFEMIEKTDIDTLRRITCMVGEIHYDLGRHDSDLMVKRLSEAGFFVKIIPQTAVRSLLYAILEKY